MSVVGDIRAGLRANIKASIPNVQVSPYVLASPTPPGVHIFPAESRYDLAMNRGLDEYDFTVQAFIAHTGDQGNQSFLDELISPVGARSMKRAIERDLTLAGVSEDCRVISNTGYRLLVTSDNRGLITVDWLVTVYVDSST
jgi:hypothetical protein